MCDVLSLSIAADPRSLVQRAAALANGWPMDIEVDFVGCGLMIGPSECGHFSGSATVSPDGRIKAIKLVEGAELTPDIGREHALFAALAPVVKRQCATRIANHVWHCYGPVSPVGRAAP